MSEDLTKQTMRVQRFLARAGVGSRRSVEKLIVAGKVTVNGKPIELGSKVDPSCDVVAVDGVVCELAPDHVYLMLNKPCGCLTTMRDQRGRPCVASLVPHDRYPGLYPVGRLDADTTGLLIFTTDGALGNALLHPSHHVWKHYLALVRGVPTQRELSCLSRGLLLDDGKTQPARDVALIAPQNKAKRTEISSHDPHEAQRGEEELIDHLGVVAPKGVPSGHAIVGLSIHEGKKHQVKRMLAAIGHEVVRLHRDAFGPVVLSDLAPGSWRMLNTHEQALLTKQADHSSRAHTRGAAMASSRRNA